MDGYRKNIFWDVAVKAGKAQTLKLKTGLVNFKFGALQGEALAKDPSIRLYPLLATTGNNYERDPKVINLKLVNRVGAKSLAAGPYLISYLGRNGEYGQTFRVVNGKKQTIVLNINKASKITATQTFTVK